MSTQKHGSLLQTEFCLLQTYMKVVFNSLCPHGLYSPWNSPGQNTGVGSFSLLEGIVPTQGSNPGLLHYRWILYQLSHKRSPRILEWVAYPFSSRSSRPRNWTWVLHHRWILYPLSHQGSQLNVQPQAKDLMSFCFSSSNVTRKTSNNGFYED